MIVLNLKLFLYQQAIVFTKTFIIN